MITSVSNFQTTYNVHDGEVASATVLSRPTNRIKTELNEVNLTLQMVLGNLSLIPDWVAGTYEEGSIVKHNLLYWRAVVSNNVTPGTDVLKWEDITALINAFKGLVDGTISGSGAEEYNSSVGFPVTGTAGTIYVAKDTNKLYRWNVSSYVELSQSIAQPAELYFYTNALAFPVTGDAAYFYVDRSNNKIHRWNGTAYVEMAPGAGTVNTANNITGGLVGNIPFQSATDTTSFISAPTVTDTYLKWNGTAFTWGAVSGVGLGDMTKAIYDTTNNGIVDQAETLTGWPAGVTMTEVGYLDGVSGAIQTQLGNKQNIIVGAASTVTDSNLTGLKVLISDVNGKIAESATISSTELSYLDGATSNLQTQISAKAPIDSPTFTGIASVPTATSGTNTTQIASTAFVTSAVAGSSFSITNDLTSNTTFYPMFVDVTTGTPTSKSVSSTKLNFNPSSGNFSSTTFTSLSDLGLKENITLASSEVIKSLRGVEFTWKDSGKKSSGVIAQEIESILPHLVEETDGVKSVNYMALSAYLIETIKSMDARINVLEAK